MKTILSNRKPIRVVAIMALLLLGLAACSSRTPPTPFPTQGGESSATQPATAQSANPGGSEPTGLPATTEPTRVSATATPKVVRPQAPIVGVEMNKITANGGLELVSQSGAHWVRRNALLWSDVEPVEGERNWDAVAGLEQELKDASAQGLQVILIVRSTPSWAQAKAGVLCGPVREDKLSAFASFMHDAVARYSEPPYNVKYWELGNEPDIDSQLVPVDSAFGCWGDAQDEYYGGGYYAGMLKAVYPQVKAADPQSQVLSGGLLLSCDPNNPPEYPPDSGKFKDCTPARFLEGILKNGGGDYLDGVSFHAYDFYGGKLGSYGDQDWHSASDVTGPGVIAKSRYLRSLLAASGHPEVKLFNTETALLCVTNDDQCTSEAFNNSKAYFAAESNASALAEGLTANVWYSITGWRSSGLVDKQRQPLPVYDAFSVSAKELKGAGFVSAIDQFPGVKGYEYLRDGTRLWVLWSLDGGDHAIELPSQPSAVKDVFGQAQTPASEITVTLAPIYLEWPAK